MSFGWLILAVAYLSCLFWIAKWGDKNTPTSRWITSHPLVYTLALGIYCTAWTFFGAVGQASRDDWIYLSILLGPSLVYLFFHRFLYKLILVSKKQHISTISDFISARYGKRQIVALLVTLIALLATIPYIALQLKAIGSIFELMTDREYSQLVIVISTLFIAVFAMYFGTRSTDVTEYRRGLMLAISFESIVKLVALVSVAFFGYQLWEESHSNTLLEQYTTESALSTFSSFTFWAQTLMAAAAVICLPRQFHVAVIDNLNLDHLQTARWVFPAYLFIIALTIPIIAAAGADLFNSDPIEPDTYVLGVANLTGSFWIQLIVFFGGLSAAIAMIIVATLTLSTMLTNDVILPRLINIDTLPSTNKIFRIKMIRRIVILLILGLSFLYQQQMTYQTSLAAIGLVAFSLVIQLLPAIIGGLYWKQGHAHGVYAGLISGLIVWTMWLMLPLFSGTVADIDQSENISLGAMISLLANIAAYIGFSWLSQSRLIDRIQAEAFVSPLIGNKNITEELNLPVTISDMHTLIAKFTGEERCDQLFNEYAKLNSASVEHTKIVDESFLEFCERALGGAVGSSSAKALIDGVVRGQKLDVTQVVNFFDDTTQSMQFNVSALMASLENIDQGISVIDKNLNLLAWNTKYSSLFNFPEELVRVGTPIEKMIRHNVIMGRCGPGEIEQEVKKRLDHLKQGTPHKFIRQRDDGTVLEMVGNPIPEGGFVTSFHDITNHVEIQQALEESNVDLEQRVKKRTEEVHSINAELRLEIERRNDAEKELIRARQEAENANASKTRFLALASHDVLQPLNAAKLYLTALQESELSSDTVDIVKKLNDSVVSSETLISTILDISRLDQGELKPYIETVNIREVVKPIINELSMKAKEKGLHFSYRMQDLWVSADRTYLFRIVQNFVSNAVKYTEKGKVLVVVRKRNQQAHIAIYDTGIGIPKLQQTAIFSDFYRVDNNSEKGIGLGLGVVKRLTAQMKCQVKVRSEEGKGSLFSVIFDAVAPPEVPKVVVNPISSVFSGLKILCVDDQQENLDAMSTLLCKWGIEVKVADHFEQAMSIAEQFAPQILLVDYQLGKGPNGLEIIENIRLQSNSILPACLITAKREDSLAAECRSLGVNYMNKPVKPAKLRTLIQSMTKYIKYAKVAEKPS